jgi:hypothetical protein
MMGFVTIKDNDGNDVLIHTSQLPNLGQQVTVTGCPHCAEHERTIAELRAKLTAMVGWLETNQKDVFKRGLWGALAAAPSAGKMAEPAEPMAKHWRQAILNFAKHSGWLLDDIEQRARELAGE